MCITSTFAGAARLDPFGLRPPLEYSKDTQQLTASNQIQPDRQAAQPCSYIYPIYSVVKNRRAVRIAASPLGSRKTRRALGRLEHSRSRFSLREVYAEAQPEAGLQYRYL
jgi:hypothetical protein